MFITCKNCHATFKIKAGDISKHGRIVHCNECDYEWVAHPNDDNINQSTYKRWVLLTTVLVVFLVFFGWKIYENYTQSQRSISFAEWKNSIFYSKQLTIEETSFYEADEQLTLRVKIRNTTAQNALLDSVLTVITDNNGRLLQDKVINLDVEVFAHSNIIVPIPVKNSITTAQEDMNVRIYTGGKYYLLWKSIVLRFYR